MKVLPVRQNVRVNDCFVNSRINSANPDKSKVPSFKSAKQPAHSYPANYYISRINSSKNDSNKYPKDVKYREQLLENAGLNPENSYKLRPIAGPQEILDIMKDFDNKPEVFSVGKDFENVKNRSMRANLHMHTLASDGSLSVAELLDKAAEYADKVKNKNPHIAVPFVVAITDHDTTEGAQEAIKVISEKPEKYKNLRVILGAEITTFNNIAPNIVKAPTNSHVLLYGIDPNEKIFKSFIDETKNKKSNIQNMMISKANKVYKNCFGKENFYSTAEAKYQFNPLSKNIIGIYNGVDAYLKTKAVVEEVVFKDEKLKNALVKNKVAENTDQFMEKLSEYSFANWGKNRVRGPEVMLPAFIASVTDISSEETEKTIREGVKSEKISKFGKELSEGISEFKVTTNPKYDYMPTFKTISDGLSGQDNAVAGIAHPVDYLKPVKSEKDKYPFLEDLYKNFKSELKEKAKFTEAYYQSYKPAVSEFNQNPKTQKFFAGIAKVFKFFRTGSADTHGLNIFIR